MKAQFPTAEDYALERAKFCALEVVDIQAVQQSVADLYKNQVLLNVNDNCVRLSVFEGEYRWHYHPTTDELFLVAAGELHIEFDSGAEATLREWQSMVVPAGTVHRTRAVGRVVNITCEKQAAEMVFVEPPAGNLSKSASRRGAI